MENKVGDIVRVPFEIKLDSPYQNRYVYVKVVNAVANGYYGQCLNCYYKRECCRDFFKNAIEPLLGECSSNKRSDKTPVYFVKDHFGNK